MIYNNTLVILNYAIFYAEDPEHTIVWFSNFPLYHGSEILKQLTKLYINNAEQWSLPT